MELFSSCPACCSKQCHARISNRKGTYIEVNQHCSKCSFRRTWSNQPLIRNKTPPLNMILCGAIVANGLSYVKVIRMLKTCGIATFSAKTFKTHFEKSIQPVVHHFYFEKQKKLLNKLKNKGTELHVGGDGRADSPGYSAKFGTYTLMDLDTNKILHFELVQICNSKLTVCMQCIHMYFCDGNDVDDMCI